MCENDTTIRANRPFGAHPHRAQVGDTNIEHPEFLLEPGRADHAQVVLFYRQLHDAIRAHDNEKLLLYSGMEISERLTTSMGFEAGPDGPGQTFEIIRFGSNTRRGFLTTIFSRRTATPRSPRANGQSMVATIT